MKFIGGKLLAAMFSLSALLTQAQTPQDNLVDGLDALQFPTKSTGGTWGTLYPTRDWNLWSNGHIETTVVIPHDTPATRTVGNPHKFSITAYGSVAGTVWPLMTVYVDGVKVQTFTVNKTTPVTYTFTANARAGMRKVRIAYTNDAIIGTADRNLYVRNLQVYSQDFTAQLPATAGSFPLQSISLLAGFYPSNVSEFGLPGGVGQNGPGQPVACPNTLPGCRNIDFIKGMGGTDVTLVSSCVIQPGTSWCAPQINWNDEETALRVAIRYARSKGLTVTLKPFILAPTGFVIASSQWAPSIPSQFFDSIEANFRNHARIAREEGVSLLVLGAELGGALTASLPVNNQCARWKQLITNVRSQAAAVTNVPAGSPARLMLTYSPTMAGYWNYLGSNEAPYVCFWDQLDYIGLNAYHHMNYRGVSATATPASKIGSGWNAYKRLFSPVNSNANPYDDMAVQVDYSKAPVAADYLANFNFGVSSVPAGFSAFDLTRTDADSYQARYNTATYSTKWYADYVIDRINERFKTSLTAQGKYPMKAILTEVGVPSSPHVQGMWGETANRTDYRSSWSVYVDEQARAWDGYLRAFRGDPRIHGISMWGLLPYRDRTATYVDTGWLVDYDFNAKVNAAGQKVTEEQLCKWLRKGHAGVSPCVFSP